MKFGVALVAVALVWLIVLPRVANTSAMAERIEWLQAEGIDPSAMYYTELEMMGPILDRLAVEQRRH